MTGRGDPPRFCTQEAALEHPSALDYTRWGPLLAPPIAAILAPIADVLAPIPAILSAIPYVLAEVTTILGAVAAAAVVPRVTHVLARVTAIFVAVAPILGRVPSILTAIPYVFSSIATILRRDLCPASQRRAEQHRKSPCGQSSGSHPCLLRVGRAARATHTGLDGASVPAVAAAAGSRGYTRRFTVSRPAQQSGPP